MLFYVLERTNGVSLCSENEFFNLQRNLCQVCTVCKHGQALRRTCSKTNDTLCGMINFSFLDGHKEEKQPHVTDDDYSGHFTAYDEQNSHRVSEEPTHKAPYVLSQENEREWKNLAFALIGVLSVLIILTTLLVLIICYKVRHTGWFCKSVTGIDQEDTENGYVVIHRFVPVGTTDAEASTSPHGSPPNTSAENIRNLNQNRRYRPYRPKRRLMNEYTDEVFDSEDSAGSRSLRSMLETIQERSEGS